jgi:hypothetical protein
MPVTALLALRGLFAAPAPRARYALPRWAFRNAELAAAGPRDFPWHHDLIQQSGWGSASEASD